MDVQYIYLIKEREFIKTNENIIKIGKTKQPNLGRMNQYPKGSMLLCQVSCPNCDSAEIALINIFRDRYQQRRDIGNEYFEGDQDDMVEIITKYIIDDKRNRKNKPHENEEENADIVNDEEEDNNSDSDEEKDIIYEKCNNMIVKKKKVVVTTKTLMSLLICQNCKKNFQRKENLEYHISHNACKTKIHKCNFCDSAFTTTTSMYRHMKHNCNIKKQKDDENEEILNKLMVMEEKMVEVKRENAKIKKQMKSLESKSVSRVVKNVNINKGNIKNAIN